MPVDKDLATAIKRAKTTPMFFVLVLKGGAGGALIVDKQKISADAINVAKKKSGGSAVVKGRCFAGEDDEKDRLIFETPKVPAASWENAVKKLAKDEAGVMISPLFRLGADPDTIPEAPANPEEMATVWNKEFAIVNSSVANVVQRSVPGSDAIKAEFRRAQALADKKDYQGAVDLLATVTDLIEKATSTEPPTPTVEPSAAEAEWGRRLAGATPDLKEALAIGTKEEIGSLKVKLSEAQALAKQKSFSEAIVALNVAAQLAQGIFDAHDSPGPVVANETPAATWKRLFGEVSPLVGKVVSAQTSEAETIKQQFRAAQALADQPDFAAAVPALRRVKSLALKALVAMGSAASSAADDGVSSEGPGAEWKKRLKAVTPDLTRVLKEKLGDAGKIRSVFAYAQEKSAVPDFPAALKGLDALDGLLRAALTGAPGSPANPTAAESKEKQKTQAAKFKQSVESAPQRSASEEAYLNARKCLLPWKTRAEPSEYDPLELDLAAIQKSIDSLKFDDANAASAELLESVAKLKIAVEKREAALALRLRSEALANLNLHAAKIIEDHASLMSDSVPAVVEQAAAIEKKLLAEVKPSADPKPDAARETLAMLVEEYESINEINADIEEARKRLAALEGRYAKAAPKADKKNKFWVGLESERDDLLAVREDATDDGWAQPFEVDGHLDQLERNLDAYLGKAADTAKRTALKTAKADLKNAQKSYNAAKKEATPTQKGLIEPIGADLVALLDGKELLEDAEVEEFNEKLEDFNEQLETIEQHGAQRKSQAEVLESGDGGHSLGRHGPNVSKQKLVSRLTTGYSPDGVFSPTKSSSKFESYEDWNATRDKAVADAKARGFDFGADMKKAPPPGGQTEVLIVANHGRAIGSGVKGVPASSYQVTVEVNKTGTVYGEFVDVPELKKTTTTFRWTGSKWVAAQHFPSE